MMLCLSNILMMMHLFVTVVVVTSSSRARIDLRDIDGGDDWSESETGITNADNVRRKGRVLTMEIPGTPVRRLIDPHGTWMAFMRHSERTNRRQRAKNARKTKQLNGLRGPTGPQGPRGPPGPPGAEVTQDVLLQQFRDVVREAAERKAQGFVDIECTDCNSSPLDNITGPYLPPLFEVDEATVIPRLLWGFHCRLQEHRKVARRALVELNEFHVPFVPGGFQRGDGIHPQLGRFTVPRNGVYNFVANLHVKQRSTKRRVPPKNSSSSVVRSMICINSLCQRNTSLETVVQISEVPWYGTITIAGLLELEKGQYVSIYVDNSSSDTIHILDTTYFSGSLAGL